MKKYRSVILYSLLFLLMFCIPMLAGMIFSYRSALGYISPAILLLITAFVYHRTGRTLNLLGFRPIRTLGFFLPLGLISGILLISLALFLQKLYMNFSVQLNEHINYWSMLAGIAAILPGVLNEELIFRGICFKEMADQNNSRNANILFGFLFMVWHWISWNAWGNYPVMLGSFTTAIGHLLFATALLRSGTIYFPIGLHLGINWAQQSLFHINEGDTGADNFTGLFIINSTGTSNVPYAEIISPIISIGCFLGLYWWIRKKGKPITQ